MQHNSQKGDSGKGTPKRSMFHDACPEDEIDSSADSQQKASANSANQAIAHDPMSSLFASRLRLLQLASEQKMKHGEHAVNASLPDSSNSDTRTGHHAKMQQELQYESKYGKKYTVGLSGGLMAATQSSSVELNRRQVEMDSYQQQYQRHQLENVKRTGANSTDSNRGNTNAEVASHLEQHLLNQSDEQQLLYLLQHQQQQNSIQSLSAILPTHSTKQHSSAMEELLLNRLGVSGSGTNVAQSLAASSSSGDYLSELRFLQLRSQLQQLQREQLACNQSQIEQKLLSQYSKKLPQTMNIAVKEPSEPFLDMAFRKELLTLPHHDTNQDLNSSKKSTSLSSSGDGAGVSSGIGYSILRSRNPFFTSYQDHIRSGSQLRKEYQKLHKKSRNNKNQQQYTETSLSRMKNNKRDSDEDDMDDVGSESTGDTENELEHQYEYKSVGNDRKPESKNEIDEDLDLDDDVNDIDDPARGAETFPFKLYMMIKDAKDQEKEYILSFLPHGCAFAVHQPTLFVSDILPKYFKSGRMSSFQRQLNLYGFRRISDGPDRGGYWHENFLQDCPLLCKDIARKKTSMSATTGKMSSRMTGQDDCGVYSGVASLHSQQASNTKEVISNLPTTDIIGEEIASTNPIVKPIPNHQFLPASTLLDQANRFDSNTLLATLGRSSLLELVLRQQQQQRQDFDHSIAQQNNRSLIDLLTLHSTPGRTQDEAVFPTGRQNLPDQLMGSSSNLLRNMDSLNHMTASTASLRLPLTVSESLELSSLQRQQQQTVRLGNSSSNNNNHRDAFYNNPRANDTSLLELLLLQQLQQQKNNDESNQPGKGY